VTHSPATLMRQPGDLLLATRANLLIPTTMVMVVGGMAVFLAAEGQIRIYGGASAYFGFLIACCISFGEGTKRYIQEARGHFRESSDLPDWFLRRASRWYCFRSGVVAVMHQEGRRSDLPPKFQNWMTPTLLR